MNIYLKENKTPLLVGLTGGIGSGKSTVAKIFKAFGVPIFNSDDVAKSIVNSEMKVKEQISSAFGELYQDEKLNKAKLAEIVFNDVAALKKLNEIVHPAVGREFKKWVVENHHHPILVKEAAILIESGAYKELDKIILVKASEKTRIERVMKRNNVSEAEVVERMKNQMNDEEKEQYCDYFVNNENEMLIPQVINILDKLKSPE